MPTGMCTKPCSSPIVSCSTKCMTEFRLYETSDTENYQLVRLNYFFCELNELWGVYKCIT